MQTLPFSSFARKTRPICSPIEIDRHSCSRYQSKVDTSRGGRQVEAGIVAPAGERRSHCSPRGLLVLYARLPASRNKRPLANQLDAIVRGPQLGRAQMRARLVSKWAPAVGLLEPFRRHKLAALERNQIRKWRWLQSRAQQEQPDKPLLVEIGTIIV